MHLRLHGCAALACCILLCLALSPALALADDTCTTGAEDSLALPPLEPGQVRAITRDGEWVLVKPLDDPGNPYRELYSIWDRWLMAHFDPALDFSNIPSG